MPCFHPLKGYRSKKLNENGKRPVVFSAALGFVDIPINVPCGKCIGCRLEKSKQWAMRCLHESSLYDKNCFITLTFNEEHLPEDYSLNKSYFQNFMKRLRKEFIPKNPYNKVKENEMYEHFKKEHSIRYFHCGEYGEECKNCGYNRKDCRKHGCGEFVKTLGRPHFHACLFNFDFNDKILIKEVDNNRTYISPTLDKLWKYGYHTIGDVSFESAAYIARYVTKKVDDNYFDKDHYTKMDKKTGEIYELEKEYLTMSRIPGIGREWINKFKDDIYPDDFVVVNGIKMKPPKYYDNYFEEVDEDAFNTIKYNRKIKAEECEDNTPERLEVREKIQLLKAKKLVRSYE